MLDNRSIPALAPLRVLLIARDDTVVGTVSTALAECLSSLPDLVIATTGRTAVDLIRREPVEMAVAELEALSDLDPSPEDAVARLAKSAGAAIVLVLSVDASVSVAVAAMRSGAHDCIARPLTSATLAERLTALTIRHGKGSVLKSVPGRGDAGRGTLRQTSDETAASQPIGANDSAILPMWRQEQQIIEQAIARFSGNVALAAAALQLSPSTIYRKRQAWAEAAAGRKGAA
jgi:DNA-binding NtrC family response regulator